MTLHRGDCSPHGNGPARFCCCDVFIAHSFVQVSLNITTPFSPLSLVKQLGLAALRLATLVELIAQSFVQTSLNCTAPVARYCFVRQALPAETAGVETVEPATAARFPGAAATCVLACMGAISLSFGFAKDTLLRWVSMLERIEFGQNLLNSKGIRSPAWVAEPIVAKLSVATAVQARRELRRVIICCLRSTGRAPVSLSLRATSNPPATFRDMPLAYRCPGSGDVTAITKRRFVLTELDALAKRDPR